MYNIKQSVFLKNIEFQYKSSYKDENGINITEYYEMLVNGIRIIFENILLNFYNSNNETLILYDNANNKIFIIDIKDYDKAYEKLMCNISYNIYLINNNLEKKIIYTSYNKDDAIKFSKNYVNENINNIYLIIIDNSSERFNNDNELCLYKINLITNEILINYDHNIRIIK